MNPNWCVLTNLMNYFLPVFFGPTFFSGMDGPVRKNLVRQEMHTKPLLLFIAACLQCGMFLE